MTYKSYNSASLFTSSIYGLQNAYQLAKKDGQTGVTQKDLWGINSYTGTNSTSSGILGLLQNNVSSPFASYMATNFNQLDTNKDGQITDDEMSTTLTNVSQKGLSYQQLMNMPSTTGLSTEEINDIIKNFSKIDRNGDGYVSMTEINYYNANKEINEKIQELKMKKASSSNFSIFYASNNDDED